MPCDACGPEFRVKGREGISEGWIPAREVGTSEVLDDPDPIQHLPPGGNEAGIEGY